MSHGQVAAAVVRVAPLRGFSAHELRKIKRSIEEHQSELEGPGMTTSVPELAAVARSVRFDNAHLVALLVDGRELRVPLARFPRLQQSSAEQRAHWRLIGRGVGIHWPDVDEDVSVPSLLGVPSE
jgi:hypothetical protein